LAILLDESHTIQKVKRAQPSNGVQFNEVGRTGVLILFGLLPLFLAERNACIVPLEPDSKCALDRHWTDA
jgi:hypothetical protein